MTDAAATWARWNWKRGLGRWHRLFTDGDLTRTACDTPRKSASHVAEQTATKPTEGPLCPLCEALDLILESVLNGELTHAVSDKPIAVPATPELATVAAVIPEPIEVPADVCICGCDNSPHVVALRAAVAERNEAIKAAKRAEFDRLFPAVTA